VQIQFRPRPGTFHALLAGAARRGNHQERLQGIQELEMKNPHGIPLIRIRAYVPEWNRKG